MNNKINNTPKNLFSEIPIADLVNIPQHGEILLNHKEKVDKDYISEGNFDSYVKTFFTPWFQGKTKLLAENILKYFNPEKKIYAEDFSIRPKTWFKELLENANLEKLGTINLKAIVINNSSLRTIPTANPGFYDPRLPGEGFPFDNFQGNLLHIGEPVLISHFTRDGSFALVETNTKNFCFVQTQDLAFVDNELAVEIPTYNFIMAIADNTNLYSKDTLPFYLNTVNLGTLLPIKITKNSYNILLPIKGSNSFVKFKTINTDKSKFITSPLVFTPTNVAKLIDQFIDKPYGWGGYLQNRDCAQLLKDYYALFGIHIPIFSADQIKTGNYISLENKTPAEKLAIIDNKAQPFKTLLYRKGHITLYLGKYNNQRIMFHAVWGVHLYDTYNTEYRHIIGKSIISTLEYGKELENYTNKSSFLQLLSGMTIIE